MIQEPLISVLIPCFNAEIYIHKAVDSIISQTYKNLEILLIDDGSRDKTRDIIIEYSKLDTRVIPIFNEKNLGLIRTLNKGVKYAKGQFIARMDADDISDITRIEILYKAFVNQPEMDVISAAYFYMSADGKHFRRVLPKATLSKALLFVSFFSTPINHPCLMAKTEVLVNNPFDEDFIHSEDYELFSRLLLKGYKFKNLETPLYYLRVNPYSVSHRYEQIQIATHMKISVQNIQNYFHKSFDYFKHKVIVNRIGFDVSIKLMKEAISEIGVLKSEFIAKEKVNEAELLEINDFIIEQRIDIYLQSLKYAKWVRKPVLFVEILLHSKVFMSRRGWLYFRLKFYKPFATNLI